MKTTNRELKFRAWFKEKNIMQLVGDIELGIKLRDEIRKLEKTLPSIKKLEKLRNTLITNKHCQGLNDLKKNKPKRNNMDKLKMEATDLKLEHLAPYLPHGLKCMVGKEKVLLIGLDTEAEYWIIWKKLAASNQGCSSPSKNFKPILRPLSDLTKEIEINGKKFVPVDVLKKAESMDDFFLVFDNITLKTLPSKPAWLTFALVSVHFDIFGLIKKELAIDINKLTTKDK